MSEIALEGAPPRRNYFRPGTWPFWGVHLFSLAGIIYSGWSWTGLLLAVASYYLRMFFVTAGYHRYFSHKSYKTSRVGQMVLAFMAQTSIQKGVLWWAGHHRAHHRYSDKPGDPHSPRDGGLWWSHAGWILVPEHNETRLDLVPDLAKYPELVWLSRNYLIAPVSYAVVFYLVGGWHALLWGFFVSTVLTWHGTFTINSLTHIFGRPRYASGDDSKNSWSLALITMGEGWHNNHHFYQNSVKQGFYWWEFDFSYYVLWLASRVGLVWDLRKPPAKVLDRGSAPDPDVEPTTGALSLL